MEEFFELTEMNDGEEAMEFDVVGAFDTDDTGVIDTLMVETDYEGIENLLFVDEDENGVFDTIIADFGDGEIVEISDVEQFFAEEASSFDETDAFDDADDFDEIQYFDEVDEGYFYSDENSDEAYATEVYDEYGYLEPGVTEGIIGDPTAAMRDWHSQTGYNCAVDAQEFILEDLLGEEFSESGLQAIAEENGWLNPECGTPLCDMGNLLEYYGIETENSFGNTFGDLRESLADGNKIVVSLDGEELWFGQNDDWFGPGMDANHAVQVVGIDERDPDDIRVIINDSGVANGKCVTVPADIFISAWEDSNCHMVEAFAPYNHIE